MRTFNKGEKVKCVDNAFGELSITIGKVYTLTKPYTGHPFSYLWVLNDFGTEMGYYPKRFKEADHKEFTDDEYESLLV